jgi:hypothetical protein
MVLPKGLNLDIQFIDPPSNNPTGPEPDPNVKQPVRSTGANLLGWDGCGCGGGNCVC